MDPVLIALAHLIEVEPEIELLNFFKSYPITIKAKILKLDPNGTAYVKVLPPGSVCLFQNKSTTLLSNYLADAVYARIMRFDIVDGIAVLGSFAYLGPWSGRRMIVRVQPSEPIPVELKREDLTIRGQAADISLIGMGVTITNPIVKKDEDYKVHVAFPSGEIVLNGTVLDVITGNDSNRLSIKFAANSRNIAFILDYISERRVEIQAEVQRLYNRVYQTAKA
jgi:hypothetical protein